MCCLGCHSLCTTPLSTILNTTTITPSFAPVSVENMLRCQCLSQGIGTLPSTRYGIRYNAPLLDLGINKNEERKIMKEHNIEPDGVSVVPTKVFNPSAPSAFSIRWTFSLTGTPRIPPIAWNSSWTTKAKSWMKSSVENSLQEVMIPKP